MSAIPNAPASVANSPPLPPTKKHKAGVLPDHETNGTANESHHENATSNFQLNDEVLENFRPVKVIVIGAGYSGIYCGIRIPERLRNCELVIYEKNAGLGGTWYENKYPGCACDIPCKFFSAL